MSAFFLNFVISLFFLTLARTGSCAVFSSGQDGLYNTLFYSIVKLGILSTLICKFILCALLLSHLVS